MYPLYAPHHQCKNELQELTSSAQTACNFKLIQSKAHLITGLESLFLLVQFVGRRLNCRLQQRNALPNTHDISNTMILIVKATLITLILQLNTVVGC